MLNDSGMIVTSHEYLPFGEDWVTEGDTKNAPKYNSQELDKESGYYFYNARHYDPEIARFVTPDTVVPDDNDTQSWNRLSYVNNNPILYKDPTGHILETVWDVASLAMSVGELAVAIDEGDTTDIALAAASVAVDAAAVLLPCVPGGAGAALKATKAVGKKVAKEISKQAVKKGAKEAAEKVAEEGAEKLAKTAAKKAGKKGTIASSNAAKSKAKKVGSYEIEFSDGKKYYGKGSDKRMETSAKRIKKENPDVEIKNKDWKESANDREAYKDEYKRMVKDNVLDPKNDPSVYNKIQSPGKKYIEKDGY